MNESTINIPLLKKVQRAILAEPRRLNMEYWVSSKSGFHVHAQSELNYPACETVGCIAGWALVIAKRDKRRKSTKEIGRIVSTGINLTGQSVHDVAPPLAGAALGLPTKTMQDALFMPHKWPDAWKRRLDKTSAGTSAYAQVVSDYIDYFISVGGQTEES